MILLSKSWDIVQSEKAWTGLVRLRSRVRIPVVAPWFPEGFQALGEPPNFPSIPKNLRRNHIGILMARVLAQILEVRRGGELEPRRQDWWRRTPFSPREVAEF